MKRQVMNTLGKSMKGTVPVLAALVLMSCGSNADGIANVEDLKQLAEALSTELQGAKSEHVYKVH